MNPAVALLPCTNYEPRLLDSTVDKVLKATVASTGYHGHHILMKPNLISAQNGHLACSEPALLCSIARWFIDHGAQVQIGDSPAFGSSRRTLQAIGAAQELESLGVKIIEFTQTRKVETPLGYRFPMAAAAIDCDLLVNVPRLKAHAQTRVTMSVKNLFGCIKGLRKGWWHMAYGGKNETFTRLIGQLPAVLSHSIHLLDGIKAMHVTGPIHGKAIYPGILGCSTSGFSLDSAFLHILGIPPEHCPLWKTANKEGNPDIQLNHIQWACDTPDSFSIDGFIVPDKLAPIRFNPCRFMKSSVRRVVLPLLGR
ncbi:MAG: hypothetical protein CSA31_01940 [Desulfobulbus propionicus]|nr:MAG: hypothetical protein CSB34_06670 [Desulfobulbus propionicus]PIE60460.1 MAG: hypothetical protein CSA31_01940 [Desulfobulbus propionicus]